MLWKKISKTNHTIKIWNFLINLNDCNRLLIFACVPPLAIFLWWESISIMFFSSHFDRVKGGTIHGYKNNWCNNVTITNTKLLRVSSLIKQKRFFFQHLINLKEQLFDIFFSLSFLISFPLSFYLSFFVRFFLYFFLSFFSFFRFFPSFVFFLLS